MTSLINDSDPIIRRLVVPIISKCAAIGGFDSDSIEECFRKGLPLWRLCSRFRKYEKSNLLPMISSLSPSSANFCVGLFHLIDTPAGLVPNFDKIIRKYIDGIELQLIRTNPR